MRVVDFVFKNVPIKKIREDVRLFAISFLEEREDWMTLHVVELPEDIKKLAEQIEEITSVTVSDVRPHDISSMVLFTLWCELDRTPETERLVRQILEESEIRRCEEE